MKDFIIKYFRSSVLEGMGNELYDPEFNMTDEDLEDILKMALITLECDSPLESVPNEYVNALILLGKREVYYRLATKNAPLYDVDSETVKLKKEQRFRHYYSLLQELNSQYNSELASGKFTYVKSGELLLDGKHYNSARQYALAKKPTVALNIDKVYSNSVEISWSKFDTSGNNKFSRYIIYVNNNTIIDIYNIDNNINYTSNGTKAVGTIYDIHRTCFRVTDLEPNTEYHIAIISQDINSLFGFEELVVTTLPIE